MISNFLFHRVNPERDLLWDPMDIPLFERCIKYIVNHYTVVLIEDLALSKELYSTKKYATIMFDDGYKDNIQYALPILEKYSCKASFYVVTDCIDKNIPTWTHILEHTFQHTKINDASIDFDFFPEYLTGQDLSTKENRIQYVVRLKPFLKKLPYEQREIVLNKISSVYTDVEIPSLMMDWNDLKLLVAGGHYVGSHTVKHGMLGTMTNESDLVYELQHSANRIKDELGYFPITISYPIGSYNAQVKELSKKIGYKIGLAVKQKLFNPDNEDLFEIPRIELYNDAWWKTRLRITNTLEKIKSLIRYK